LIRTSVELPESASEYPLAGIDTRKADLLITPSSDVQRNQVVVRTTPTNSAGIGSVVAQLRSGAAVAAMLGATFATFSVESEHAYQVASLLRLDLLETQLDARTKVCSLAASPGHARASELVEGWCGNGAFADAQALELRGLLSDCDLILDDRPWEARYDMSKCTWRWVNHVFSTLGTRKRTAGKRAGGIGLHIRWGDMADDSAPGDPRIPERSTPIETAARLLRKLRECGVEDELSVYMESHNATMLSGLGEPYRIVDTGDDIDDLLDLASNRLMILGLGSYAVLAHQIAEGGITVVPDTDLFGINWYDNGVNHVLRMHELLSIACSDLSVLFL
jgi:hypothetical protein